MSVSVSVSVSVSNGVFSSFAKLCLGIISDGLQSFEVGSFLQGSSFGGGHPAAFGSFLQGSG